MVRERRLLYPNIQITNVKIMIKEAIGDRFLLVSLTIFLLASVLFAYFLYEDSGINLAFGQPLTDRQKARAIDIAMANPIVINEGGHYAYTITGPYHVKDVLPPRPFHEVGPGIDRVRSLPAVEVVAGNESEPGFNILAFVDRGRGRVAHIGYMKRADASGRLPQVDYDNISLAETGYRAGDILAGEQRDKVIRIAMQNKAVQEKMRGMHSNASYRVVGNVSVSYRNFFKNNSLYVSAYPVVQFGEEASIYVPSLTIYVTVDPDRGKVLDSMVAVNTPVLERPGNAS